MVHQPTCIVEVIQVVAPEDVPVVAARVAERLAMPVERVQKLIDARVGPITRPLRPDKAEAIAQTFEAAGVVVAIRPSTEDDEPDDAAAEGRDPPPEPPAEAPGVERDPEPPAEAPGVDPDPEPAEAPGVDPDPEPAEAPGPDDDPTPTDAAMREPGPSEPARRDPDPDEPARREPDPDEPHPGDPDPGEPPREPDPEPPDPAPSRDPVEEPLDPYAPPPSAAGVRFAAAPRSPASLRIEPDDADDGDGPNGEGLEARGEIPPRRRPLLVELGEAASATAPEEALPDPRTEGPMFTDEASWSYLDDDASGRWTVPRRGGVAPDASGRAVEPAVPDPIVVDDPAAGHLSEPDDPQLQERGPVIGRAGRRRPVADLAEPREGVSDLGVGPAAGADPAAAASRSVDGDGDAPAGDEPQATAPAVANVRPVPVAWRGLGDEASGPARPPDASVPRRLDPEESLAAAEARRVAVRRTVLLWALVIAVVLLALSQFWAAGRAAVGYDHGLHRFRDAQFGAARSVWSRLAAAGDANAQFMLGYMSETGLGQPWSARAAASWYRMAADRGHAEAQWRLGGLSDRGLGVPWDPLEARRWWSAAADGGHAEAAFALGRSLFTSPRSEADLAAAASAFDRAASLGWHEAASYVRLLRVASDGPNGGAVP